MCEEKLSSATFPNILMIFCSFRVGYMNRIIKSFGLLWVGGGRERLGGVVNRVVLLKKSNDFTNN